MSQFLDSLAPEPKTEMAAGSGCPVTGFLGKGKEDQRDHQELVTKTGSFSTLQWETFDENKLKVDNCFLYCADLESFFSHTVASPIH